MSSLFVSMCYFKTMALEKPRTLFGYARATSHEQPLDPQIDALVQYGVQRDKILTDPASGKSNVDSPGFCEVMKAMYPGAAIVVWKLDRLGHNLSELIQTADLLRERGAQLISLTEQIDTETDYGKIIFQMVGMFAQLERDMTSERTRAGLAARKVQGKTLGRKSLLVPGSDTWNEVVDLMRQGLSFVQIAEQLATVSKSTLYNHAADLRADMAMLDIADLGRKTSC